MNIFDALAKPFPESSIHWRVGSTTKDKDKGIGLAYIDARDVMQRLDDVVGNQVTIRFLFTSCPTHLEWKRHNPIEIDW